MPRSKSLISSHPKKSWDDQKFAVASVRGTLETAVALDPSYYTDANWYAFEQRHIFKRTWQFVGHVSDLTGIGDHIVAEVARQPLIVVRQANGELKAFHNVCRHRAGPVALCNGHGASRLRCAYHGWQYGLDGQLIAAPEMGDASGFDKSVIGLPEVACAVWQGLVFVALADGPPPLAEVTAGIADRIMPGDLTRLVYQSTQTYDVACNWKVYVDNYLEGYHLPYVHPALTQVVDYADYTSELSDHYSLQVSPITDPNGPYGEGTAYYYFLYPNIMLNIVPGRLQLNRVIPTAIDRCQVDFLWFFDDHAVARIADDLDFTARVQTEDAGICAAVQRGLASGSYTPGRLSPKREAGLFHFQNLLRKDYALGR